MEEVNLLNKMVHPAYGDDCWSAEEKAEAKEDLRRSEEKWIEEHRKYISSIKEDVFKEIEAYQKGELRREDFYSTMIAETILLGRCQEKYEIWIENSERNKDLAKDVEGIILDGMLNRKRKSSERNKIMGLFSN